ncbi:hypothetical protein BLOT_006551 [Blomia tropicalis]|nr:hypothetical protein BLOT_006551 [Blomia tropicalis]
MSKTSLIVNGANKHQEAHVSIHSKWSSNGTAKFGSKTTDPNGDSKRGKDGNSWGPLFKSRSHFNEMHIC